MRFRSKVSIRIAASIDQNHAKNIVSMRNDVMALRENFNELVSAQKTLGFDDLSGLRGNLHVAGNAVERIINENMSWLARSRCHEIDDGVVIDATLRGRLSGKSERGIAAAIPAQLQKIYRRLRPDRRYSRDEDVT